MKKIISLVVVLALLGLFGPNIIGNKVNDNLEDTVASINKMTGYSATIESRSKSWFETTAVVNVEIDPELFGEVADMGALRTWSSNLNVSIQHGPFLTLNGLDLGLFAWKAESDEALLREFLEYGQEARFYSIEGKVGLLGSVSYIDNIPSFSISNTGLRSPPKFSGWSGEGLISATQSNYMGKMDSFVVAENGDRIEIKSVKLNVGYEGSWADVLTDIFYESSMEFAIGSIYFDAEEVELNLEDLLMSFASKISEDGKLMNIDADYSIGEIGTPLLTLQDLLIKTEINNLEKEFVGAYQKVLEQPFNDPEVMANMLKNSLLRQLEVSPELNFTEISGKLADKGFSAKLLTKVTGIDTLPDDLSDPLFWRSKMVIDSNLTLDKAAAILAVEKMIYQIEPGLSELYLSKKEIRDLAKEKVEEMVLMLVMLDYITVNQDDEYEMAFTMQDGQAMLNGKLIPLPY